MILLTHPGPSMYGATPSSALGVYEAEILILNGIIKKTDESKSFIISVEPLGASCCHPQSLSVHTTIIQRRIKALSLPLPAHGSAPRCLSLPSRIGGNIISDISASNLMCDHTHCTEEYQAATPAS